MSDNLCKLVKKNFHKDNPAKFKKLTENPTHVCKKCDKKSSKKGRLCKPSKI